MSHPRSARGSLWVHLVLLTIVLTIVAAWLGTGSSFITDEAFVRTQVDVLEDTGAWPLPHPFPEADPDGVAFPLHNAERFDDGYVLYGKHPALVYVYVAAGRLGGELGLIMVSVLGTVVAAGAAGLLSRRWHPTAGAVAVWITGIASPLFFDSFVVHAHTIGAALAALAVLAALEHRRRPRAWSLLGLLASVAALTLLRTEGLFFVVGLATALVVVPLRPISLSRFVAAGGALVAGAAAVLLERPWAASLGGTALGNVGLVAAPHTSAIGARTSGLAFTWFLPGYRGLTPVEVLTAIAAVLVIAGAWMTVRRPQELGARLLPVLGGGLLLVRSALEPGAIPGLLIAFCVGWAGLLLLTPEFRAHVEVRFSVAVCAIYALGVLATQYPAGGHTEWGGRYFALLVPVVAAVAAAAFATRFEAADRDARRLGVAAVGLASVGLAILSITTLQAEHERNDERVDDVFAAASVLGPASDGGTAVVVTEDEQIPRLAEERGEDVRFLLVDRSQLADQLDQLAALGIEDLLVVSKLPSESLAEVPASYELVGTAAPHRLQRRDDGGLLHLRLVQEPP